MGVCGRNGRFVDVFCFFPFFPFLDGEAGLRKTAVLMIVWSVKDLKKDFL